MSSLWGKESTVQKNPYSSSTGPLCCPFILPSVRCLVQICSKAALSLSQLSPNWVSLTNLTAFKARSPFTINVF